MTEKRVRELVNARDGGRCVSCGSVEDLQQQHVRARGMGGSKDPHVNGAANRVTLCARCHALCEARMEYLRRRGYWRFSWDRPGPVFYVGEGWFRLEDDGTRTAVAAA